MDALNSRRAKALSPEVLGVFLIWKVPEKLPVSAFSVGAEAAVLHASMLSAGILRNLGLNMERHGKGFNSRP